MKANQRIVLALGLGLAALAGLFPPWQAVTSGGRTRTSIGVAPIFAPPHPVGEEHFAMDSAGRGYMQSDAAPGIRLHFERLAMYWAVIALLTGAGYAAAGHARLRPRSE